MSRSLPSDASNPRSGGPVPIVAGAALVLAIVAIALSLLTIIRPAAGCQVAAWDAVPTASEMPSGWTVGSTNIYRDSQTTSITGPNPGNGSVASTIYLSVTCFPDRAQDVVDRMEQASKSAGRAVTPLDGIGEVGYAVSGDTGGASAMQFRRGTLVAYLATSGPVTDSELRQAGTAVDAALRRALGDTGVTAVPASSAAGTPGGSPGSTAAGSPAASAGASPEPSGAVASPVAPQLEALMPHSVSGATLLVQSTTGDQVLGDDAASKALISALNSFGKKPTDLEIAQAADDSGAIGLTVLGFRLPGVSGAKLEPAVLRTWLFSGATGVTTKVKTVGGVKVTEVTYGGDTSVSYVTVRKDAVIVIQSADAALAAAALDALP